MDLEEHAHLVGRVIGMLQSLELLLRFYLYAQQDPPYDPLPEKRSLDSLIPGDVVGVNALTDYSTLGKLIDRYNKLIEGSQSDLAVDRSIVELRDALAHGRVLAPDAVPELFLLKFAKPARHAKTTKVIYSQKLTKEWLKAQVGRVRREMEKLRAAPGSPVLDDSLSR